MAKVIQPADDVWARRKQEMWDVLGSSISTIPVRMWERSMFFKGISNAWWLEKTKTFPTKAKASGTHPIYVLARSTTGFRVCPCSSKGRMGKFIRQGCKLKRTGKSMDRNSYILERFAFNIPKTMRLPDDPVLIGIVPEECLAREGR